MPEPHPPLPAGRSAEDPMRLFPQTWPAALRRQHAPHAEARAPLVCLENLRGGESEANFMEKIPWIYHGFESLDIMEDQKS